MARIGILGAGQLGRMLALAGYPLGLSFRFLDPAPEAPAEALAERLCGAYDDPKLLRQFAEGLAVATFEFENVPVTAVEKLSRHVAVFPSPNALFVGQDRLHEKEFFERVGMAVPPYVRVDCRADLEAGIRRIGLPAILKTRRLGYDGKGQARIVSEADVEPAWRALGGQPLLLERLVRFDAEVSIIAARNRSGATAFYPLVENTHGEGILLRSRVPASCATPELERQARAHAQAVLAGLEYVGVLAIEFFVENGVLLANEMAPRVHNSGHWSIEGAETSQFENHLRALLNWPLGHTEIRGPSVMYNIIGVLPNLEHLLALPGVHVHLYGKAARPRRKLGHVTVTAPDLATLQARESALAAVWNANEAANATGTSSL
ncbi:MAG: N5-carboxyaminoimidazole ribonucleotide synthase [Candidatus Binatia bacterium]|nr:MAG: N5-carboxyaminoimidazole ribonucleotide synthase [Candidatus Binatia bacterium]